jgi:glycosyltransferase involved in cell wall biosynthesis
MIVAEVAASGGQLRDGACWARAVPVVSASMDPVRQATWVVIAAYNEAAMIGQVVAGVVAEGWRVVVVDDGSTDDTAGAARVPGAIVLRHAINLGQGAALQTGIDFALRRGAARIVTFDADGQHSPADLPAMVAALDDADIALGSRALGTTVGATRGRRALLRLATRVSNRMSGMQLTDAHCGLRAFRASVAPRLRITQDRMAHASELLSLIRARGLRVVEVPVTIRYTAYSMRKGQSGFQAIRIMFDHLFRT